MGLRGRCDEAGVCACGFSSVCFVGGGEEVEQQDGGAEGGASRLCGVLEMVMVMILQLAYMPGVVGRRRGSPAMALARGYVIFSRRFIPHCYRRLFLT